MRFLPLSNDVGAAMLDTVVDIANSAIIEVAATVHCQPSGRRTSSGCYASLRGLSKLCVLLTAVALLKCETSRKLGRSTID